MAFDLRVVATMGVVAAVAAGGLMAPTMFPAAFASEPQSKLLDKGKDLFPLPFDTKRLRKFDILIDDSMVSTEVQHTEIVKKIGFGKRSIVTIVTTPTGTYSSDAITDPHVRYPGIDLIPRAWSDLFHDHAWTQWGHWTSVSYGSFTYLRYVGFPGPATRT